MSLWQRLAEELDLWHTAGRTATFWWRDDDAAASTPQLELLLKCAQSTPLALAVIPRLATAGLAERLRDVHSAVVLQHGWAHTNHSAAGRSEYPPSRSEDEVVRELREGQILLRGYFGAQSLAVFVPPWHSFDDRFLALLPKNGIHGISRKGPRPAPFAARLLIQVNAHVAPINWTVPASFDDDTDCLSAIIDHLCGRRTARYDPFEPTGLLTHHMVQNQRSFEFMSRFIDAASQHPAGKWLAGRDIFSSESGGGACCQSA